MNDVECPYCGHTFDVDITEREQEVDFEVQCPNCDKYCWVSFCYFPSFEAEKAPCLNGEPHVFQKCYSTLYGEYEQCLCGETRNKISYEEAITKYNKELNK